MTRRSDPRPAQSQQRAQVHTLRLEPRSIELRASGEGDDGPLAFRGRPVVYDRWTEIFDPWFGSYMERIAPGAAAGVLDHDVRLLINHDPSLVLARTVSGTLRLGEDRDGVVAEAELAPTSYARDVAVLLQRGDVSQMSFSFVTDESEWDVRPDGMWMRTVTRIAELYDVAIVTFAAYQETEAALRARFPVGGQRAGRRNSAADEQVIRSAIEAVRGAADELEGLLEPGSASADDDDEARLSARVEMERRHHEATARRYRMEVAR